MSERALKNPKIEVLWNQEVTEVLGDAKGVNALKLKSTTTGEEKKSSGSRTFFSDRTSTQHEDFQRRS